MPSIRLCKAIGCITRTCDLAVCMYIYDMYILYIYEYIWIERVTYCLLMMCYWCEKNTISQWRTIVICWAISRTQFFVAPKLMPIEWGIHICIRFDNRIGVCSTAIMHMRCSSFGAWPLSPGFFSVYIFFSSPYRIQCHVKFTGAEYICI